MVVKIWKWATLSTPGRSTTSASRAPVANAQERTATTEASAASAGRTSTARGRGGRDRSRARGVADASTVYTTTPRPSETMTAPWSTGTGHLTHHRNGPQPSTNDPLRAIRSGYLVEDGTISRSVPARAKDHAPESTPAAMRE